MTAITQRLMVTVSQAGGVCQQLLGRSAAMVMFLVVYHDQINESPHGKVTFEWDGVAMRPHLFRSFDHINTERWLPASDQSST